MTDKPKAHEVFLIEKAGLYYRPESMGYTGMKSEAGRYSFEEAVEIVGPNGPEGPRDDLSMWREVEAPDYSGKCYWDVKMKDQAYRKGYADALAAQPDAARIAELENLINTPEVNDFMKAVPLEAAHQVERWGPDHDAHKTPMDWFWVAGYLSQKAAMSHLSGDMEKAQHHCITVAALCLTWHKKVTAEKKALSDKEGDHG